MKIYKWSRITNNAACIIGSLGKNYWTSNSISMAALLQTLEQIITNEPIKNWRDNVKNIVEKAQSICDNWDIRKAKVLLDIFPTLIAKKYRGETPIAGYDEKGNWILVFN